MLTSVLEKLEKYTGNLEDIVSARTRELTEEKKKTDLLLYSMMPQSVHNIVWVFLYASVIEAKPVKS